MKIITYKNHNSNVRHKANPSEIIEQALIGTNLALTFLGELKPELTREYITALKKRLTDDVQDFHFDSAVFDLDAMRTELTVLKEHLDVQELEEPTRIIEEYQNKV